MNGEQRTVEEISRKNKKWKEEAYKIRGERDYIIKTLEQDKLSLAENTAYLANCELALAVIQQVAEATQRNLEFHISNIVTLALSAVFPDPYEFKATYLVRRGKTECDLKFVKNGQECDPLSASGGGACDVASFSLRIAVWSLKPTRNVQVLDEPFRFVSLDLQEKCSEMIKELSSKLGIQIIMVSHLPKIIAAADTIFEVTQTDGISEIKLIS